MKCSTTAMHRVKLIAAARRCALRKSKTPGRAMNAKKRLATMTDSYGYGNVVAHGRARRRRLRTKRSGFADARHSHGAWLDDPTLCDRHPEGIADLHAGSDTQSGSGPLIKRLSGPPLWAKTRNMVRSVLVRLRSQQSGTCRKPHDVTDIGTLLDKTDVMCSPVQNEAKERGQIVGLFMILKCEGLNASEVGVGKCFENSQLCSFDVQLAKANALQ